MPILFCEKNIGPLELNFMRIEITMNSGRQTIKKTIEQNKDILFQNRNLTIVSIDDSFPEAILNDQKFIKKYSL